MKQWELCEGCEVNGLCKNQKEGRQCNAVKRFKKWIKNKKGDKK